MGRLTATHATQCNKGNTKKNKREQTAWRDQSAPFEFKKRKTVGIVLLFVDKASIVSSNISVSHIRAEEIQNFTLERFNFTRLSLNRVYLLIDIYMWLFYISFKKELVMSYFFFPKEQESI